MSVTPLRPATVGATANPSAGTAIGPESGDDFIIKLQRYRFGFWTDVENTKGDGDAYDWFDISGDLHGAVTLYGIAVSNVAMGLANLANTTKNPTAAVTLLLSSTREITASMAIHRIDGEWARKNVTVPLVMQAFVHNTNPASLES